MVATSAAEATKASDRRKSAAPPTQAVDSSQTTTTTNTTTNTTNGDSSGDKERRTPASQTSEVVVRLARDRWPSVVNKQQHGQSTFGASNREISEPEAKSTPASPKQHQKQQVKIHRPPAESTLIHTDHLNASSPLLYVFVPSSAGPSASSRAGKALAAATVEESAGSQSSPVLSPTRRRVSILSASYASPPTLSSSAASAETMTLPGDEQQQQQQSGSSTGTTIDDRLFSEEDSAASWHNERQQPVVPRLVVLNLEVGSSSATLTWSLTLFPAQDEQQQQRRRQVLAAAEPKDKGGAEQQRRRQARLVTGPPWLRQPAGDTSRKVLIVKRDTIRVTPTLKRQQQQGQKTVDGDDSRLLVVNKGEEQPGLTVVQLRETSSTTTAADDDDEMGDKVSNAGALEAADDSVAQETAARHDTVATTAMGRRQSESNRRSSPLMNNEHESSSTDQVSDLNVGDLKRFNGSSGGSQLVAASKQAGGRRRTSETDTVQEQQQQQARNQLAPSFSKRLQLSRVQGLASAANHTRRRPPTRRQPTDSAPPEEPASDATSSSSTTPAPPTARAAASFNSSRTSTSAPTAASITTPPAVASSISNATDAIATTQSASTGSSSAKPNAAVGRRRPLTVASMAARQQQQQQQRHKQQHLDKLSPANTSSTTAATVSSQVMGGSSQQQASVTNASVPLSSPALSSTVAAGVRAGSTEPPMIRAPSVPLNRILVANSIATTTNTKPQRGAKSLSSVIAASSSSVDSTQVEATLTKMDNSDAPPATTTTEEEPQKDDSQVVLSQTKTTSTTTTSTPTPTTSSTSTRPPTTTTSTSATTKMPTPVVTTIAQHTTNYTANSSHNKTTTDDDDDESHQRLQRPPDVSKWLIRLRRFASNEVDIIKVVVSNLGGQSAKQWAQKQQPPLIRQISFKNLEPSSGYELCIESASPNQQVGDRFQILDANHFLKCHDTSDVELRNASRRAASAASALSVALQDSEEGDGDDADSSRPQSIQRMDMITAAGGSSGEQPAAAGEGVANQDEMGARLAAPKLKSLCKEFFTLPANSSETISFGGQTTTSAAGSGQRHSSSSRKLKLATTDEGGGENDEQQQQQSSSNSSGSSANPRRPKSLNNALKSHMELLEINDISSPTGLNQQFEVAASRATGGGGGGHLALVSLNRAASTGSGHHQHHHHSPSTTTTATLLDRELRHPANGIGRTAFGADINGNSSSSSTMADYLSSSALPIVGCVFGLIFVLTLANILLNSITCGGTNGGAGQSSLRRHQKRHRAHGARLAHSSSTLARQVGQIGGASGAVSGGGGGGGGLMAAAAAQRHTLGSFYSDSDTSATSQSRIVVVGGARGGARGEPFAASSAFFDLPPPPPTPATGGGDSSEAGSSGGSNGSGAHKRLVGSSSNYLISGATRFPLGPSFEGDEKHNADMVGLARKNYDNFIKSIYNGGAADESPIMAHKQQQQQHSTASADQRRGQRRPYSNNNNNRWPEADYSTGLLLSDGATVSCDQQQRTSYDQQQQPTDQPQQTAQQSTGKQRIRFDKINPIYNMELLYSAPRRNNKTASKSGAGHYNTATKGSKTLASFSPVGCYTNQALVADDELPASARRSHPQRHSEAAEIGSLAGADDDATPEASDRPQCPLCEAEQAERGDDESLTAAAAAPAATSESGCNSLGTATGGGRNHFACCLDRQKQRFEKQHQQLEMVLTKNGSLIPQPFINPTGPTRCASPDCQSASAVAPENCGSSNQRRPASTQQQLEATSQKTVVREAAAPEHDADNGNALDNNDGSGPTTITEGAGAEQRGLFLFGEQQEQKIEGTTNKPPSPVELSSRSRPQQTGSTMVDAAAPAALADGEPAPVAVASSLKSPASTPPSPPPPPNMPNYAMAAFGTADTNKPTASSKRDGDGAGPSSSKSLVSVSAMAARRGAPSSGTATMGANHANQQPMETINKTDFDRRRKELAAKLRLAGMSKVANS